MRADRITFSKALQQFKLNMIAAGVMKGDEAIGEILSGQPDSILLSPKSRDLSDEAALSALDDMMHDAHANIHYTYDMFGKRRELSEKERIKQQMNQLEEQGRALIDKDEPEAYRLAQEAYEIWLKLKEEYNRL